MAINKKLIHFQTLANFEAQLSAGNILDTSICFIKDAKKIWTHGEFYNCNGNLENDSDFYIWELEGEIEFGKSGILNADVYENLKNAKVIILSSSLAGVSVLLPNSFVSHVGNDIIAVFTIISGIEMQVDTYIVTFLESNYSYTIGGTSQSLAEASISTGSTDTNDKIYLVGSKSQEDSSQTYSHDTAYVGANGYLYSNKEKVDMRLTTSLIPKGTQIPENADLNSIDYLKVGKYFCESNADAISLSNCPCKEGFMMEVYSPLSVTIDNETTGRYIYRLRIITSYRKGIQYKQLCSVSSTANQWSYDPWQIVPQSTINTSGDTPIKKGDVTNGVYINENGQFTPMQYYLYKTVPYNAEFTDTKVTSAANHYTPSADANFEINADNSSQQVNLSELDLPVVTGVRRDSAGHIVGLKSHVITLECIIAVDTGDVVDDIEVDYATKAYVDSLLGDINNTLENIING